MEKVGTFDFQLERHTENYFFLLRSTLLTVSSLIAFFIFLTRPFLLNFLIYYLIVSLLIITGITWFGFLLFSINKIIAIFVRKRTGAKYDPDSLKQKEAYKKFNKIYIIYVIALIATIIFVSYLTSSYTVNLIIFILTVIGGLILAFAPFSMIKRGREIFPSVKKKTQKIDFSKAKKITAEINQEIRESTFLDLKRFAGEKSVSLGRLRTYYKENIKNGKLNEVNVRMENDILINEDKEENQIEKIVSSFLESP